MFDRKWNAPRERCHRRCPGRQLRPGVARRVGSAFLGTFNVKADDGIRTRDLRFTKPLLYQLSYVGADGKDAIRRLGEQARTGSRFAVRSANQTLQTRAASPIPLDGFLAANRATATSAAQMSLRFPAVRCAAVRCQAQAGNRSPR